MLAAIVLALFTQAVYSLPAINFTDSAVPNQMVRTLSEAHVPQGQLEQQHPDPRGRAPFPLPAQTDSFLQGSTILIRIKMSTGTTFLICGQL